MSKITRAAQKIFGINMPDVVQFGSKAANAFLQTFDVVVIQALASWGNGWRGSLIGNNVAGLQDQNAVNYVTTYQLAYLFQEGIAEYDASTTYYQNSLVKNPGTTQIYKSLIDGNTGNSLTNGTYWQAGLDIGGTVSSGSFWGTPITGLIANTPYHATTDGLLSVRWSGSINDSAGDYTIYVNSDTNATPTTQVYEWHQHFQATGNLSGDFQAYIPISINNYYKILLGSSATFTSAQFIPLNI